MTFHLGFNTDSPGDLIRIRQGIHRVFENNLVWLGWGIVR